MSYELKSDDEILKDLALKLDRVRRYKKIKDTDLVAKGGTNRVVLNKFRSAKGGISLRTFIRLLRGLGELNQLETILKVPMSYSPSGKKQSIPEKRVRTKKVPDSGFTWGDDE